MLKKITMIHFVTLLFLLTSGAVFAAEDPIQMLQTVTQKVFIKLKNNTQTMKYEPEDVYPIIDNIILPHIDFLEMARWVVGRNAWRAANNDARNTLVNEFKTFVVKRYTKFLVKFTNEKVAFFPLREDIKNDREIQVSSQIEKEGQSPIRMDYRLVLQGDSWKVYDIIIEGVSMLEGYQAQFAPEVRDGGVAAVITKIRRYNAM